MSFCLWRLNNIMEDESFDTLELEATLYKLYRKGRITLEDRFSILRGELTLEEAIERKENGQARYY